MAFLHPALLWAIAAVGIPLLIHWLLRPRARRVRFPAVRMLAAALSAGQRAQRITHWRLLAVRGLFLAALATLLAGPRCHADADRLDDDRPRTGVIVLDESWSTLLGNAGAGLLWERLRDAAIASASGAAERWPGGSQLGLVSTSPASEAIWPTSELPWVADRLRRLEPPAAHAATLAGALELAVQMLERARPGPRELIICTDLAAHAWRDVPAGALAGIEDLTVRVIDGSAVGATNLALLDVAAPPRIHPAQLPLPLVARVLATGVAANATLVVQRADAVLARSGPHELPADVPTEIALTVPPQPPGVHGLSIRLEPEDRLAFDQTRYLAVQCGRRPRAWLIEEPGAAGGNPPELTALLLSNLLAPETLSAEKQPVDFQRYSADQIPIPPATEAAASDSSAAAPELIVLLPLRTLSEAGRAALETWVERGATLLLAPAGTASADCDWPGVRRRITVATPRAAPLNPPGPFAWETASEFGPRDGPAAELTRAAVRRRVVLGQLEPDATVEARYADGQPTIVRVRAGRGQILLLTTSPDPAWSELGVRAAGLLAWLHDLLGQAAGQPDAALLTETGRGDFRVPALPQTGAVAVQDHVGGPAAELRLADGQPAGGWPVATPGLSDILLAGRPVATYAVNWPAAESDLRTITPAAISDRTGVPQIAVTRTAPDPSRPDSSGWPAWLRSASLQTGLALLVFAALLAEQIMSAGMDRRGQRARSQNPPAEPAGR